MLYALQAAYSEDIGFATRNVAFFLVPFAAMFVLLTDVDWTPRLLGLSLGVIVAEAVLFAVVGTGQFLVQEIFWNPALERSNDFHFYFRVNSLFWDPNIYGRYLALAAVLVAAVVLWARDPRRVATCAAILVVILAGMVFGLSQTSFIALLIGVGVLCGLALQRGRGRGGAARCSWSSPSPPSCSSAAPPRPRTTRGRSPAGAAR